MIARSDAGIIERLWSDPGLRKRISSWFSSGKGKLWTPTEIYPTDGFFALTKRPSTHFQQGIFRTRTVPSRKYRDPINVLYGCLAGHWAPGPEVCERGFMDIHRIDVPRSRVAAAMREVAGLPALERAKRRRVANPLLMTVGMPPLMNPSGMGNISIPFSPGAQISFDEFQQWIHSTRDPVLIEQLNQAVADHQRFHGSDPVEVGFAEIALGGPAMYPPAILTKAGVRTAESYRPHARSNKGQSVYVHEFEDEPPVLFGGDRGAQFTLSPMTGSSYIDDWFRG